MIILLFQIQFQIQKQLYSVLSHCKTSSSLCPTTSSSIPPWWVDATFPRFCPTSSLHWLPSIYFRSSLVDLTNLTTNIVTSISMHYHNTGSLVVGGLSCLLNQYFSYDEKQNNCVKRFVSIGGCVFCLPVVFCIGWRRVWSRKWRCVCRMVEPGRDVSDVWHPQFLLSPFLLLSSLIPSNIQPFTRTLFSTTKAPSFPQKTTM